MAFLLLLGLTATLFLRPGELYQPLADVPIYELLVYGCLLCSLGKVLSLLNLERLIELPANFLAVGMLFAVFMSHASHLDLYSARYGSIGFSKALIYYLLLLANVDTVERLKQFMAWLVVCICFAVSLAIAQYHGVIDLPALSTLTQTEENRLTGELVAIIRLRSTGIFNDPNDLAMIIVLGIVVSGYFLLDGGRVVPTPLSLAVVGLLGYGLFLTKSRGGMMAFGAAGLAIAQARWGTRRAVLLAALALPLAPLALAGRQAALTGASEGDTGQDRIRLWSEGLRLLRRSPLFGIGQDQYDDEAGLVAHNTFIHCFAELGFFGGAIFLGLFAFLIITAYRMGRVQEEYEGQELQPFMLATSLGTATSLLSLSRPYVASTYLCLGLGACWLNIVGASHVLSHARLDRTVIKYGVLIALAFLVAAYLFVRTFARFT